MTAVNKCDACERITPFSKVHAIRVYETYGDGTKKASYLHTRDVCPACYAKLKDLLKIEEKEKK